MEPQEGDIAENGQGAFLVYRGGDWYPAQADGRPKERIPRPDYGSNHFQLPNGDIVRQGPKGGQETVENFGGAGGGSGGSGMVSADQRGRYNIGANPLVRAEQNLAVEEANGNPLNRDWGAVVLNAIDLDPRGDSSFRPFAPLANIIGGQDYQNTQQALSTYEASLMPIQSGASVTASEAARQIRADFPALGDSPETQRRKAANRMDRINAILAGIGKPPAFSPEDIANPSERSTNREIDALALAGSSNGADGPQPGDVRVIQQPLAPTDSPNTLSAAGYVYDPARDTWSRSSQVALDPQAVRQQSSTDRSAQGEGIFRKIDAGVRGAADTLTFGLADEISAGLNTALPLDRGSESLWTAPAGDAYRHNLAMQRGIDQADARDVPVSRVTGQVAGALVGGAGVARALPGAARMIPVAADRAVLGAGAYGAAYGFGSAEGNALSRAPGAAIGSGAAAAAPLAAPVANVLGNSARSVARPVMNALQRPGPLASGIDQFAARMGSNRVNALAPRLAEQRALGMEPALVDLVDDASVGRVRALATRDTPARDLAVRAAETRRANLPSRAARIAREEISEDTRPALEVMDAQRATRRQNADAINSFGADPVPLPNNAAEALRSPLMRTAFSGAAERAAGSLDPSERAAAPVLEALASGRASATALNVREAQDMSKALNDAASAAYRNGSPDGPVLKDLANAIRDSARESSPGYRQWLQRYGEDSDLIEAATTGRNLVSVSTDPVNARSTEAFVRTAEGAAPAVRSLMRAAGREAVEVASSNPAGARTTLDRFAGDVNQARRLDAIGVDSGRVAARSQAEIDAVTRAQRASPRVGSESSTNLQDAGGAAGATLNAIRRPVSAAVEALGNRLTSRGFNDAQAEAIVNAAYDTNRTDELVGLLAQRMTRREARNLARAIRYQVTTAPQSGRQG